MKYGTDGFRGPVDTHVTSEFCLKLGFHTGCLLKDKGYESVIIGKYTRVSGYMLESALQAGFISAGIDVKLAGPIPTPAVSFLTSTYSGQFGVVISASHNPFQDNGIKFFNRHGRKISEEFENLITEKVNFLYLHQLILVRENLEEEDGQTPTFIYLTQHILHI